MKTSEAVALIERGVRGPDGVWADLGAGTGTFTRALVELLGPGSRIYAVDNDPDAIAELERLRSRIGTNVIPVDADFTRPLKLPGLGDAGLDGILLANALHFVRDAEHVLGRLVKMVRLGGRVVLVEYDRRSASRWVPYPIAIDRLASLAAAAGLTTLNVIASRPSKYQGMLYAAAADRATPSDGAV